MASATDTGSPEPAVAERGREQRPRKAGFRGLPGSRLGRLILALNLLGLAILVSGALILNELRRGLVNARIDSLTTQGEMIASILNQAATVGEPEPKMDSALATDLLQTFSNPKAQRARLFDAQGRLVADSEWMADEVERRDLPPARAHDEKGVEFNLSSRAAPPTSREVQQDLAREVGVALQGRSWAGMRPGDRGARVVSVSIPIQHVRAVLGVVTLEARDVDAIIARERAALIPFILIAVAVTLASSLVLNSLVAQPVLRMARAADRVRQARARAISLPDLAKRDDELGDLTRSLEAMTQSLSERMDAIEAFAADVAHEIRNPLTSLRSAVETLDLVSDPAPRERLMNVLKNDVQRLDRLVTDISNASRLDAELSRDQPKVVDLGRLIGDIVALYQATAKFGDVRVAFAPHQGMEAIAVLGREGPLGQILRNLIDNARSFSPPGDTVTVGLVRVKGDAIVIVADNGPGIPPENLETVFERFYTSRPKGAAFGGNSGLGLSIARQIAAAHGGSLRAENRTGAEGRILGAMFILTLPGLGLIRHAGLIARRTDGLWRGVLIEGPSGAGKSDLALRALDQGFRLVADDRVLVWAEGGRLYGRAPETLAGLIEVRGVDVLRVEPVAFCEIALLARLGAPERIPDPATETILGVPVPLLAVAPFETSAPAKLSRAMTAFDAAHKRRI